MNRAVRATAVGTLTVLLTAGPGSWTVPASAAQLPGNGQELWETSAPEAIPSVPDDQQGEELLQEDMSRQDMDQMIEEYFSKIESGAMGAGDVETDLVTDPELALTREEDGRFRYTLPNGSYFITTAPQGMISSEPVNMALSGGVVGVLRKDDALDVMPDSWRFTEPGSYHVRMLSYQAASETFANYNVYEINYYFTIVGETDGRMGAVPAPEGFEIDEVRLDGQPVWTENRRCFFLKEDGRYQIRYVNLENENIRCQTTFVYDTTAPFLSFSGELEEGGTAGPLEFYPSESDCRVSLIYNGEKGYAVSQVLTAPGSYELRAEDPAGNARSYYLRIRQTYEWRDTRLILAGSVVLAGVVLWMLFIRRNTRVF